MNPRDLTPEERLVAAARIILDGIEENMIAAAQAANEAEVAA